MSTVAGRPWALSSLSGAVVDIAPALSAMSTPRVKLFLALCTENLSGSGSASGHSRASLCTARLSVSTSVVVYLSSVIEPEWRMSL